MISACCPDLARSDELIARVSAEPYLMEALHVVAASGLPDAWIGAGVIRDVVWGQLHDGFEPAAVHDIDVGFFDPNDLTDVRDEAATERLTALLDRPWEAINQAAVHTWYADFYGEAPAPPLTSMHEAVATGPEFATSVALRLIDGAIAVCAPYGVDDLLDGVWRHNPVDISLERSLARLRRHRITQRWPRITVVLPAGQLAGLLIPSPSPVPELEETPAPSA
jgi:uncharacterized protein